jgi:hypothetical protein
LAKSDATQRGVPNTLQQVLNGNEPFNEVLIGEIVELAKIKACAKVFGAA